MSTLQRPTTRSYVKKNNINMLSFFDTEIGTKKRKRSHVLTSSSKSKKKIKKEFEMDDNRLLELLSKQQKTSSEKEEFELLARLETLKQPFGIEISEKDIKEKYGKLLKDENPDTQLNIVQTLKNTEMVVEIVNNSEQLLNGCNDNIKTLIDFIKENRGEIEEKFKDINDLIKNMKLLQKESEKDTKIIFENQEKMLKMLEKNFNNMEKLETDALELSSLLTSGITNISKMIILSPFKIANLIVFKPAGYFLYHVFGKWCYLIWGGLMCLLIALCFISIYIQLKHHNPKVIEYLIIIVNIFKNIIFSIFGGSCNKLYYLFDGTLTIVKQYLLNGYEIGKIEFYAKLNNILLGIKNYLMDFIPKFPFYDGKNVNKLNSFKYKIVMDNNSKKIKLVKLKTNSLKSIINKKSSKLKTNSLKSSIINKKSSKLKTNSLKSIINKKSSKRKRSSKN